MQEQQTMAVADGRITLRSDPGLRVEVDETVRAVESVDRRNQLSVVARLTVSSDDRGGLLRLVPERSARGRLSVVIELVSEHALLPFDEETGSWSTVIAPDRTDVLLVVEHPAGTSPDVVLATLEQSRPRRPGVTRGIPPVVPPVPQQYSPPPTMPPQEMAPPEMAPESGADFEAQVEAQVEAQRESGQQSQGAEPPQLQLAEVGASMPAVVVLDQPVEVVVRLSRGEVRITRGTSHDEQVIVVDPSQPITVTLLRKGLVLADDAESGQRELDLPAPGEPDAELAFRLRAIAVGEAEVQVVLRQDWPQPLATLRLTSTVLPAGSSLPEGPQATTAEATSAVAAGVSTFLAPRTLTIDENLEGATSVLTFDLVLPDVRERFEHVVADKSSVLAEVFRGLDDAWALHRVIPNLRERSAAFQADLCAIGARLASRALPPELLTWLREHPDDLDELTILTSGETDIPWELVHTGDDGHDGDPEGRGFLGRAGLVRWVYNTPHPRDLRIREGAAWHLVPEYADPRLTLPNSVLELDALVPFGAKAISPSDGLTLSQLLSSGEVDLLHFAGHGRCDDTVDPPVREMLLADYVPPAGDATADRSRSCWSLDDLREALPDRPPLALRDPGPLVVINACRLGQPPSRRSEAGGFAESFLRAGAGAFVGCLWSVGDEPARAFVEEFYARLDAGDTMARATIEARQAARRSGDLSWLAYTVYAHPDARLTDRPGAAPTD